MPLSQRIAFVSSLTLLALILAGLVARRLYRLCYAFPAYLLAVWLGDLLMFMWSGRFYTWNFWVAKEVVYAVLKLAVALEITSLAYGAFPQARIAVRVLVLIVLSGVLALVIAASGSGPDFSVLAREQLRRTANGVAVVYCGVWGLVLWYRLPLHPLHGAILRGLVVYLLTFAAASTATLEFGEGVRQAANIVEAATWTALLTYWIWTVWRPQRTSTPFMMRLQQWRGRA